MKSIFEFFKRQRESARLGFILSLTTRVASSLLSLLWTRLLLRSMGDSMYGLFISFQSIASLGGLGDLGMGGAVGRKTTEYLALRREEELKRFLAAARTLFLILSSVIAGIFLLFSPFLPGWLGFRPLLEAGSLTSLFAVYSLSVFLTIVGSYYANINYACGNVTWGVFPGFLLGQITALVHLVLAKYQLPLWVQYIPYILTSAAVIWLTRTYVKWSYPQFSRLFPLLYDFKLWKVLGAQSMWVYFWCLGTSVYTSVDRLLINAGFGSDKVPYYHLNYKTCELAVFVISMASFVSMPKISRWLISPDDGDRSKGIVEAEHLSNIEVFAGCFAALAYLAFNSSFMNWWLGPGNAASWQLQTAFAANLAITVSGNTCIQIFARKSDRGGKIAGIAVVVTAMLNLVLSFIAMKLGSMVGIAVATVIAQSIFALYLTWHCCSALKLNFTRWMLRTWGLPMMVVALGVTIHFYQSGGSPARIIIYALLNIALLAVVAKFTHINSTFVKREFQIIKNMFKKPV